MKRLITFFALIAVMASKVSAYDFVYQNIAYTITSSSPREVKVVPNTSSGATAQYSGNITIPETVFYGGLSYTVTSIGYGAFSGDKGVTSVSLPNTLVSIAGDAFYGCVWLQSIVIPNGVTSIGSDAFASCSKLSTITLGDSVADIGSHAFRDTPWFNNQPDGLVYAGKVAYKYKGTMPSASNIVIASGTVSISSKCFYGCTGLVSVEIPNSVTKIGAEAFLNCSNLIFVTNYAFEPQTIDDTVFSGVNLSSCSLLVPANSYNAYIQKDVWKDFIVRTYPAMPSFSPEAGEYQGSVSVSISAEDGAEIHYTLDGSEPTSESPLYSAPIVIDAVGTTTVKAIAIKDGVVQSDVASSDYTITNTTFDVVQNSARALSGTSAACRGVGLSGNFLVGVNQVLDVSGTAATFTFVDINSGVQHTSDGGTWGGSDFAIGSDDNGVIVHPKHYNANYLAPWRWIYKYNCSSGAIVSGGNLITLSNSAGYTTTSTDFRAQATRVNGNINERSSTWYLPKDKGYILEIVTSGGQFSNINQYTVSGISGYTNGALATAYRYDTNKLLVCSPNGLYNCTISGTTANATNITPEGVNAINLLGSTMFKFKGHTFLVRSTSNTSGASDFGVFDVTDGFPGVLVKSFKPLDGIGATSYSNMWINVRKESDSAVTIVVFVRNLCVAKYTLTETAPVVCATPTANINGGTFDAPQQITLSTTTSGGTIRYTLDGSEPNESSQEYTAAITISSTTRLRAKTFKYGCQTSAEFDQTYIFAPAAPVFSPEPGTYYKVVNIAIASETPDAEIHVTFRGETPTADSFLLTKELTLTKSYTVKAVAIKDGVSSEVVTGEYIITDEPIIEPDQFVFTEVMTTTDDMVTSSNGRFSTGYNNAVFVTDKSAGIIYKYDKSGNRSEFTSGLPSSIGSAITSDDAGNILIQNGWAGAGGAKNWIIIERDETRHELTVNYDNSGVNAARLDASGRIVGNVLSEEGAYWCLLPGNGTNGAVIKLANGEQVSITPVESGFTADYTSIAQPVSSSLSAYDADPTSGWAFRKRGNSSITRAVNRSSSDGFDIFKIGNKTYTVEPIGTAYCDGYAIYQDGMTEPVAVKEETFSEPGGQLYQSLTARVSDDGTYATIYQNVSGKCVSIYRYGMPPTSVNAIVDDGKVINTVYYNLQGVRVVNPSAGQILVKVSTLSNGRIRTSKIVVR